MGSGLMACLSGMLITQRATYVRECIRLIGLRTTAQVRFSFQESFKARECFAETKNNMFTLSRPFSFDMNEHYTKGRRSKCIQSIRA